MGLSVNTNLAALNAYRNLSNTQGKQNSSLEKLSSGLRINRAADDAAGLAISEGLKSQVGGLQVAARNSQDGISVVQTAEGSLTEVHSILQRLRDLGVQAANDSNNTDARADITTESTQLVSELGRIAGSTNFNGINLLDGSAGGGSGKLNFQVGADGDSNSQIQVDLSGANISKLATDLATGPLATAAVNFATTAPAAATYTFSETSGGTTTKVAVAVGTAPTSVQDFADKLNGDSAFAAKFTATVTKDANGAATGIQVKAIDGGTVALTDPGTGSAGTAVGSSATGLDFSTAAGAQASITKLDQAIQQVSTARANLGAYQNRFQHTINSVNVAVENLSASNSRITDTDMASEMVNFTQSQILSQAGTAMLAQANQSTQGILSLLRG